MTIIEISEEHYQSYVVFDHCFVVLIHDINHIICAYLN